MKIKINRKCLAYIPIKYNNLLTNFISYLQLIMKKIRLLTLLWVILLGGTLAGCLSNSNNNDTTPEETEDFIIEDISWENDAVINYNDSMVNLASQCAAAEYTVWDAYNGESIEDIQTAISQTINTCTEVWESIKKLWDWEWDSSLKDWVLTIIEKEIAYFSKYTELLPYLYNQEATDEENLAHQTILEQLEALSTELSSANENMVKIQEDFAKNHWFELEEIAE